MPGVDKSLRISVNMVTKTLLQYLMLLAPDPDFPELWARILQVLQVIYLPLFVLSSSLHHVLLLWSCIMWSQNTSGHTLCKSSRWLTFHSSLSEAACIVCCCIMVTHHVVTGRIWARILQVLHVVYLLLCCVTSSLQHVLMTWSCIMPSQNPSDCVLGLCCCFVSTSSCC